MSDQSDQALSDMLLTPCAVQDGSIQPVLITKQRDITFYTFTLSAEDYMELGRVERFGESENGVNRQLKERRAFAIAESMIKPDTVFAENPVGSLEGDNRGTEDIRGENPERRGARSMGVHRDCHA